MMIEIIGLNDGTTSFKLKLMHNNHPDYETQHTDFFVDKTIKSTAAVSSYNRIE